MMAEQHPAVGGMEIFAVVKPVRRRDPPIVQLDHPPREEPPIEPLRQHVKAGRGNQSHRPLTFSPGLTRPATTPKPTAQSTATEAQNADARPLMQRG